MLDHDRLRLGGKREGLMSDAAFKNALARRDSLIRELERIDTFLELYREFSGQTSNVPPDMESRAARGSTARIADASEEIISLMGRPVPRPELLKALENAGVPIGGKDPAATLASALWREKERFISLRSHGYWLKPKPYPAADYDPQREQISRYFEEPGPSEEPHGIDTNDR